MLQVLFKSSIRRSLQTSASRDSVWEAITSFAKMHNLSDPEAYNFGQDIVMDAQLILTVSKASLIQVPDNILVKIKTGRDLIDYVCQPLDAPAVKGIPKFELFKGNEVPSNVTLINYKKRRWTNAEHQTFLKKSLSAAKLL